MSIHIGLVPDLQDTNDVFSIYTKRSNIVRLIAPINDAFIDFGRDYVIGIQSNNDFIFSYKEEPIIFFNSNNIFLNREIYTTSNLTISGSLNILSDIKTPKGAICSYLDTSNINIENVNTNDKIIDCRSNEIDIFTILNTDNGIGYIGSRLGIGTTAIDKKYSLITNSNIFIDGDITGKIINLDKIISNNLESQILFENNSITIDAPLVIIKNFELGGLTRFDKLSCTDEADITGTLIASNVIIYNSNVLENPFKVHQRLIKSPLGDVAEYGNPVFGNPISVKSQHINIAQDPSIFELSSTGNLVLGGFPTLGVGGIISDYMIRGHIPTEREKHFKGYLSFSSNASEKSSFNVNKSGQLSIGTTIPIALLDIVNGFNGDEKNYIKPISIGLFENLTTSNILPFLKCITSNETKFHLTSNGTVCFTDRAIDMYKYSIESENSYLKNIETSTISNSNGLIDMSYTILSNIQTVLTSNINTLDMVTSNLISADIKIVDGFIQNLRVGSFTTVGFGEEEDQSVFKVGSDRLFFTGKKNLIISENSNVLKIPPSIVNLETDKLIIKTNDFASNMNVNAYTIYGSNKSIKMFCKNDSRAINSFVAHELSNHNGGFAMLSKVINGSTTPELHLTPIVQAIDGADPYDFPALKINYNKDVYVGASSFINRTGNLFLRTANATVDGFEVKSANIGEGLLVFATANGSRHACMNTNAYGSLDIGRGISSGKGPFYKQGAWANVNASGIYTITNADYGVSAYSSGTLHIQVQGGTTKIGNVSLSFLRFASTPNIFNIITHTLPSTLVLDVTANTTGIVVQTDVGCKVCWSSIGSC
jgi:hypothetical protein